MSKPPKRSEPVLGEVGTWTAMGIVKRLDDQKRMIDRMCRELEELRSMNINETSKNTQFQDFKALTNNLETALAANKRLADSVIKIREILSGLVRENEKLREEVDVIRRDSGASIALEPRQIHDSRLRILQALSTGSKSSTEVSVVVRRSREHTSRMLKKMVDQGLLEESRTYPAKYSLTNRTKDALQSQTTPTSG